MSVINPSYIVRGCFVLLAQLPWQFVAVKGRLFELPKYCQDGVIREWLRRMLGANDFACGIYVSLISSR